MTPLRDDAPWRMEVRRLLEGHAKAIVISVLEAEADTVRRETGLRPRGLADAIRAARWSPEAGAGMFLMAAGSAQVQAAKTS